MTPTRRRIPINGEPGAAEGSSAAPAPADPAPATPTDTPAAADPAAASSRTAPAAQAEGELEALRRERDLLADRELRLRAEFENFRRRASRELVEARDRAQGQLLSELLPVLDNLERALDAAEHHDEGKVLGGVRMTRDLFVELLRRSGVEEIETVGSGFDPHVHEAVIMQPSADEEGVVTAVLERGYRQGERVLRPARVVVSSGPAAAAGGR
jgi:molecular chaperone GrpE